VQRKIFRIEKLFADKRTAAPSPAAAEARRMTDELKALHAQSNVRAAAREVTDGAQDLKAEFARLNDALARTRRDLGALIGDGTERRMSRAADELRASVDGMDHATQKILNSVELIDDSAKALAACLKDDYKRGLAQDIQDQVVQIYEASNFQDLAGQRISNAIGIMTMVEDQISAMLDRCTVLGVKAAPHAAANPAAERGLLNGPKLDGDPGHASQRDIDKMFG
jgi:chemotaxis protein CheZ